MRREAIVEVFTEETDFAVTKVPTRKYPSVFIQGDFLMGMVGTAKDEIELFDIDREESMEALKDLYEELKWRLEDYLKICEENQNFLNFQQLVGGLSK